LTIPTNIDNFPHLVTRLGKAKTDRIRYHQKGTRRKQPNATNLKNPLLNRLTWLELYQLPHVGDILTGVAVSMDNGKPLSTQRLFNIFKFMPIINSREISIMMDIGVRQSQYYLKACKIALPILERQLLPPPK